MPQHLRTLAGIDGEVALEIADRPTQRMVLDGTAKRRDFIRFFACGQDITLESPDEPLPDEVAAGTEPFRIVGAMAGG
jgi:sulfur-carrier protein